MKWFIKALRHYADFNGRASRKEYWMFALFNLIFACAWKYLLVLVFKLIVDNHYDLTITSASIIASISYMIIMLLPSMAVTVRRLHDTGQSTWMILIGLIPFIGGIWMLGLMLMEGQSGENKYGADPKTSPEIFDESVKLKNAGITLIVATITAILACTAKHVLSVPHETLAIFWFYAYFISVSLLLLSGAFLTQEKYIAGKLKKERNAMFLLLAASAMFILLNLLDVFFTIDYYVNIEIDIRWKIVVILFINQFVSLISYILFALLVASILFSCKNKNLICNLAVLTIVFWGLNMLFMIYNEMNFSININRFDWYQIIRLLSTFEILLPIVFIFLASVFLSRTTLNGEVNK